jgi:hypothetical protein
MASARLNQAFINTSFPPGNFPRLRVSVHFIPSAYPYPSAALVTVFLEAFLFLIRFGALPDIISERRFTSVDAGPRESRRRRYASKLQPASAKTPDVFASSIP